MSNADLFVTATYVLYIAAPMIRQELWLRVALFFNSLGFAVWGVWIGAWPVVVANLLFSLMSLGQIRRAWLDQRPIVLDPEVEKLGAELFPEMTPRDLERFWAAGTPIAADGIALTTLGDDVDDLFLVCEGDLRASLGDGCEVVSAGPTVVGEVTMLNPDVGGATATVVADGARVRRWSKADLVTLQADHPTLAAPLIQGLASVMAARVRRED